MHVLEIKVPIPETHVLISKEEYEDLKENELLGQYYTMKDLVRLSGRSESWLKENLLDHPERRKEIKDFTYYPSGKGDRWLFKATGLREYLENEFLEILRR